MRALYKPELLVGDVTVKKKDKDGNYLPRPVYVFRSDKGIIINTYSYSEFEFKWK